MRIRAGSKQSVDHIEFGEEGRGFASEYEPSTEADAQQAQNEQPAVSPQPDTNTQLVTSQEQAVDIQLGTATKRGPGRPPLQDLAKIQEERRERWV
jgi:hypothetical protein